MTDPLAPSPSAPSFAELGISPALAGRAAEAGWRTATAIQAACIPAILRGRDVLGVAPTGSGKTAAFLLPLLQGAEAAARGAAEAGAQADTKPRRLHMLILSPTRELAAQIGSAAKALSPRLKTVLAVGGVSINPQMMALRGGADLVVATPGRLLDLLAQNALQPAPLSALVFDEADRLLDLGFAEEIGRVLAALPARRQTLMFSATMPAEVARLADAVLHNALRVEAPVSDTRTAPDIAQRAIVVDSAQRTPLLRHLIASEGWDRVLVFVATQYASDHVADKLRRAGLLAAALHGQLSQGRRSQVLAEFQRGTLSVLVATDLAARGIDVAHLGVVVNHDLPRSAVDHLHRVGRTGRAGAHGVAISFICADAPGSEAHFRLIEKRQQQRVPRERVTGYEPVASALPTLPIDSNGGIKGRRKSKKDKLREQAA